MKLYACPGTCSLARLVDVDLAGLDHLHAFLGRVAARPSVHAAHQAEARRAA